jgi:23S rRNA (uracil1939-C5)-methyltransferase
VTITGIAVGGKGIGIVTEADDPSLVGIKAFLPLTAPGDIVSAAIIERKSSYVEAETLSLIKASPERVSPPCTLYGECGGCELQHIAYPAQLQVKSQMIEGAFRAARAGDLVAGRILEVRPGSPFGYRRRFSLHIGKDGSVGLYRRRSREVLPLLDCPVATSPIRGILPALRGIGKLLAGKPASLMAESDENSVGLSVRFSDRPTQAIVQQAARELEQVVSDWRIFDGHRELAAGGRTRFELPVAGATVGVSLGAFSQGNWPVNQQIVARVVDLARGFCSANALDLYAGAGNFTIPLAAVAQAITMVEVVPQLSQSGADQVAALGLQAQIKQVNASVESFLRGKEASSSYDFIVADPPRSGLGETAGRLPAAKGLALISCHLPSCVRDVKCLSENGWKLRSIEPFDMFPQTAYLEILSVFVRESGGVM